MTDQKSEIIKALSSFQTNCELVAKDKEGRHGKHATIHSTIEAIKKSLEPYGLAFTQEVYGDNNIIVIETILWHTSGQQMGGKPWSVPVDFSNKGMNLLQAVGSNVTYMRRYALCSLLGLATDDDDGKAGGDIMKAGGQAQNTPPAPKYISHPANVDQYVKVAPQLSEDKMMELRHTLMDAIMEKNIPLTTVEKWCAKAGVNSVLEFTYDQIVGVNNLLEKMGKD